MMKPLITFLAVAAHQVAGLKTTVAAKLEVCYSDESRAADCEYWQGRGWCSYSQVQNSCRTTCGISGGTCRKPFCGTTEVAADTSDESSCKSWADAGYCVTGHKWAHLVQAWCPQFCAPLLGLCVPQVQEVLTGTPTAKPTAPTESPTANPTGSPTKSPTLAQQQDHTALTFYDWEPNMGTGLGNCVGDCDNDNDCKGHLQCMDIGVAMASVPGCMGWGHSQTSLSGALYTADYCYDPHGEKLWQKDYTAVTTFGNNPGTNLGLCVSDCDSDSDCRSGLVCFHQSGSSHTVPGCTGESIGDRDTCISTSSPTKNPTESPTANPTGSPTAQPTESPTANPTGSPTKNPTGSPTAQPTESPTTSPTSSPTQNPTNAPTEECHPSNCGNWVCIQWCKCYEEELVSVYDSYGCNDEDDEDPCVCVKQDD